MPCFALAWQVIARIIVVTLPVVILIPRGGRLRAVPGLMTMLLVVRIAAQARLA